MTYLRKYPLTIIIICVIIYLSFFTPPHTQLDNINNIDKITHFVMYFGFCCVLWFEYLKSHAQLDRVRLFWGAILAPIVFSGIIELLQQYATDNRSGEWLDFAMNTAGVLLSFLFSWYVTRPLMIRHRRQRR